MNDINQTETLDPVVEQQLDALLTNLQNAEATFEQETSHLKNEIHSELNALEKEYASLVDMVLDFENERGDELLETVLQELADEDQSEQELQTLASESDVEIQEVEVQSPVVQKVDIKAHTEESNITTQEIDQMAEKMHFPLQTYIDQWNGFTHIFPKINQDPVLHTRIIYLIKEHQRELKEKYNEKDFDENSTGWNTFTLYLMRNFVEQGIDLRGRQGELTAVLEQFKRHMIEGGENNEIVPIVAKQEKMGLMRRIFDIFKL